MARRSVRVTLSNCIGIPLNLIDSRIRTSDPCEGIWTEPWRPPLEIQSESGAWQSESSGIAKGTEGWVKYQFQPFGDASNPNPPMQLVHVAWHNPFIWDDHTDPFDVRSGVYTDDITNPCKITDDNSVGTWEFSGRQADAPPRSSSFELFVFSVSAGGSAIQWPRDWFNLLVPGFNLAILLEAFDDVNLEITLVLREKGSARQTMCNLQEGDRSLRHLVRTAGESSVRRVFNFKP